MITDRRLKYITILAVAIAVLIACFMAVWPKGNTVVSGASFEYPEKMFGKDVFSVDIQVDEDDWQSMLDNASAEEYIRADIVIEGTKFSSVGIRPKGNSSLTQVVSSDSDRYSFKLQADEYVDGQTFFGLDKFVLNNIQADSTYMKEYISYDLMQFMGVDSPLFTYASITVNGEDWGLYLAIESYEDSFVQRVYGTSNGNLYSVKQINNREDAENAGGEMPQGNLQRPQQNTNTNENGAQADTAAPNGAAPTQDSSDAGGMQAPPGGFGAAGTDESTGEENSESGRFQNGFNPFNETDDQTQAGGRMGGFGGMGGGNGGSLEYTDDDSDSYSSIFENAVFKTSDEKDFQRVITALKNLSTGTDLEEYFDVDQILRYFAVHTTVVNLDSYISNMQQNYALYENDGVVTILPWDYNLAFGGFQSGTATASVNFPIDTPVSGVELSERPLLAKLLEVDEYAEKYHSYLQEIVDGYFNSGLFEQTVQTIDGTIADLVKNDATAFVTYEEYQTGVAAFTQFGLLRAESIQGQLDGTIPSTTEGQSADSSTLIDASSINLSDMGSQGGGGGQQGMGNEGFQMPDSDTTAQQGNSQQGGFQRGNDTQQGNFPQGGFGQGNTQMGGNVSFPGAAQNSTPVFSAEKAWIYGGSAFLLIAAIIFAKKFKKRG